MKTENLTFVEAVRSLAKDCGIEVPESGGRESGGLSEKIFAANDTLLDHYRRELTAPGCPGAAYLRERGRPPDACDRQAHGVSPAEPCSARARRAL